MLRTAVQSPIVVALVAMAFSVAIYAKIMLLTGNFTWLYTLVVCVATFLLSLMISALFTPRATEEQ